MPGRVSLAVSIFALVGRVGKRGNSRDLHPRDLTAAKYSYLSCSTERGEKRGEGIFHIKHYKNP